ncbi:MAG: hypothetical protein NT004_09630 [Bacteroidetes bacterium]|nr:hypothetical protein [Bacteroidota bacterium]
MKLIADSGSTKTMWVLTESGKVKNTILTNGLNPYFHTSVSVQAVLLSDLTPFLNCDYVKEIHFYGAGCSTEKNNKIISGTLQQFFRNAVINIYHDILGAARSLFANNSGIAGILGTGCNSCYYDGVNCFQEVDSLGYLFGDEGAGSYLGKSWLSKYLKKQAPDDLKSAFDLEYKYSLSDILHSLYNRPYPNRFLASFSEFLAPRQKHPFIHRLVKEAFLAFVNEQLTYYDRYQPIPVSFVGSIGFYYRDILEEVMAEKKLTIGTIIQNPIEGLIRYHLHN